MPSRRPVLPALLVAAALLLTGCAGATSEAVAGAEPSASASPSTSPAVEERTGPWTAYGLPAPGSPGTGKTVSLARPRVTGLDRLDLMTDAQEQDALGTVEEFFRRGYWELAELPVGHQKRDAFRDLMDQRTNRWYNGLVKKGSGFGLYLGSDNEKYSDYRVLQARIVALKDYWPDIPSAVPAAHFRVSATIRFRSMGGKKERRGVEVTARHVNEVVVADLKGTGRPKVIWYNNVTFKTHDRWLPRVG